MVIGIDIGGSTTKIVGFRKNADGNELLQPLFVTAQDPVTSLYGAFGKFIDGNGLSLRDIEKVYMTGVGASFIKKNIYDLPCEHIPEYRAIGRGGQYISGLKDCLVVSIGTGTAVVYASESGIEYLGGTGVGGGTVRGLSHLLLKADSVEHIAELAEEGDIRNVDLAIGDMAAPHSMGRIPEDLTASNFGNLSDLASKADIASGILNMVFETVGMVSIFAARSKNVSEIVLTGNMTKLKYCPKKFDYFNRIRDLYGVRFNIPENAPYATAIGTALCGLGGE